MAGGALGHGTGQLRRVATRNVKSFGVDEQVDPTDTVAEAIGDIPESFYTEGRLVEITFDGTAAHPLDQTIPHQLGGSCKVLVADVLASAGNPVVTRYDVTTASGRTADKYVRLVASANCVATVWCWR